MPRPCAHYQQRRELVLVSRLERNCIDFDLESGRLRGIDAD